MPSKAMAQFGMIGMAVMGRNLALNILDHDYSVAGYNLEPELMQQAVEESGSRIHPTATLAELVQSLELTEWIHGLAPHVSASGFPPASGSSPAAEHGAPPH